MKSVKRRLKSRRSKRYHSAVRFTDYKSFSNFTPSSELLGYYQSSALRTETCFLCKALMKLKAQLSGKEHEVSLSLAGGALDVAVDERHYNLQVRELASGEYLLINGSNIYKCRVSARSGSLAAGQSFAVVLRGQSYEVALVDPKRLRSGQSTGAHHPGAAEIVSPMPGKIVRVLVQPGDKVEAGAGIIVVEAMKMQNEMKAPKAGIVVSINAEEGATVNAGDVLAVVE